MWNSLQTLQNNTTRRFLLRHFELCSSSRDPKFREETSGAPQFPKSDHVEVRWRNWSYQVILDSFLGGWKQNPVFSKERLFSVDAVEVTRAEQRFPHVSTLWIFLSWKVWANPPNCQRWRNKVNGRRSSHWFVWLGCYRNLGAPRKFSKGMTKGGVDLEKLWQAVRSICSQLAACICVAVSLTVPGKVPERGLRVR